jgi:hypothetical protein
MSQEKIDSLKGIANEALTNADAAESPAQRQEFLNIAEEAIAKAETYRTQLNADPLEKVASSPVAEALKEGSAYAADLAGSTYNDVNTALSKTIAGLASAPYEIPAFVAGGGAAALRALGFDAENPLTQGKAYNSIVEFAGANRPYETQAGKSLENVTDAAVNAAPFIATPPIAAAVFTEELLRGTLGDAARSYLPNGDLVANIIEAAPVSPTQMSTAFNKKPLDVMEATAKYEKQAAKRREGGDLMQQRMDREAAVLAKAQEHGVVLTRGDISGDTATIALENGLQRSGQGGILVDTRADTANNFMSWINRSFKAAKDISDPAKVKKTLDNVYQGYLTSEKARYDGLRSDLFKDIPKEATFNSQPLLDVISRIEREWNLVGPDVNIDAFSNNQRGIRAGLDSLRKQLSEQSTKQVWDANLLTFKDVPSGEFAAKNISAAEFQRILADIGRATFKGDNPSFAGIDRNVTQAIGRDLGGSIKGILDDAATASPELAQLKAARDGFAKLMADQTAASQLPFLKMTDGPLNIKNKTNLLDDLLDLPDATSQRIAVNLIQDSAPELMGELRKRGLERVFKEAQMGQEGGTLARRDMYNFDTMIKGMDNLESNLFFADAEGKRAFYSFKKELRPIMDIVANSQAVKGQYQAASAYEKVARIVTEISGVVGGTPARYASQVGERVTETLVDIMRDPRALSEAAVSPYVPKIIRKAMERQKLTQDELKKLQSFADAYRLRLAQEAGQNAAESQDYEDMQNAILQRQQRSLQTPSNLPQ